MRDRELETAMYQLGMFTTEDRSGCPRRRTNFVHMWFALTFVVMIYPWAPYADSGYDVQIPINYVQRKLERPQNRFLSRCGPHHSPAQGLSPVVQPRDGCLGRRKEKRIGQKITEHSVYFRYSLQERSVSHKTRFLFTPSGG